MKAQDQLPFVEPRHTVQTAYAQLSSIQGERPGVQVASAAVLFFVICDELKLDVSQLMCQASRIAKDDDSYFRREVKALRAYVQGELK